MQPRNRPIIPRRVFWTYFCALSAVARMKTNSHTHSEAHAPRKEADYERILWRKARRLCLRASSEHEAVSTSARQTLMKMLVSPENQNEAREVEARRREKEENLV